MKKFLFGVGASFLLTGSLFAALTEKNFAQDMAYYFRTAKSKKLNANDRIYILERLRLKYKESDFDLSQLFAEIDRRYGARLKEEKGHPGAKPEAIPPSFAMAYLTKALVTDSEEFSRLFLDAPGILEYRGEIKKDERGLNPPVVLIYLYNTKEKLNPLSKNFAVKKGLIRQVQFQTISKKPWAVKVSVALREDRPYQLTQEKDQLILTIDKKSPNSIHTEMDLPAAAAPTIVLSTEPAEAPPAEFLSATSTGAMASTDGDSSVNLISAVKSQQPIVAPEKSKLKRILLNSKVVPWATFLISMGLVMALLV